MEKRQSPRKDPEKATGCAPVRILLAEDHPAMRLGLRTLLDTPGLEVVGEAATGKEAIAAAAALQLDVVILDIRLPDMNGIEVLHALKAKNPSPAVLVFTAFPDISALQGAVEHGAAGFLFKEEGSQDIQIIGRGTRIYDGKDYFTIYDFVKAHHHFQDPEWDGEPVEPEACSRCGFYPCQCGVRPPKPCPVCGQSPCICEKPVCPICGQRPCVCVKKAKVKLADGKERTIQHMMATTFWHPDGKPVSAQQFMELLFGRLPEFFKDEEELRALWSEPQTRRRLLDGLAEKGFGRDQLAEMQTIINAERSDLFDVLAHIAFAMATLTREERAHRAQAAIHERFTNRQQTFLEFVLAHYVSVGVEELDPEKLTPLLKLKYHDSISDAVADLGPPEEIGRAFSGFQKYLYERRETTG